MENSDCGLSLACSSATYIRRPKFGTSGILKVVPKARAPRLCSSVVFKKDENAHKGNNGDGNNDDASGEHGTSPFKMLDPITRMWTTLAREMAQLALSRIGP